MAADEEDEKVPRGVCTARNSKGFCKCSCFAPREDAAMYCAQPRCGHSVEWHHLNAREIETS